MVDALLYADNQKAKAFFANLDRTGPQKDKA